jgi:phosphotransferase system  glucose/maltose/N-acetylglucosamine-specific IIC component
MSVLLHTSGGANQVHHPLVLRLMRGMCFVLFVNPFPCVVVALCTWLVWSLFAGVMQARGEGAVQSAADTLNYALCFVVLVFLACLAGGHILLTFLAGCSDDKS